MPPTTLIVLLLNILIHLFSSVRTAIVNHPQLYKLYGCFKSSKYVWFMNASQTFFLPHHPITSYYITIILSYFPTIRLYILYISCDIPVGADRWPRLSRLVAAHQDVGPVQQGHRLLFGALDENRSFGEGLTELNWATQNTMVDELSRGDYNISIYTYIHLGGFPTFYHMFQGSWR